MNIAYFLLPKLEVAYLKDSMTLKQGLEKMKRSGFAAVPVIDREDRYVGVVSEGDFLWSIMKAYDQTEAGRKMLQETTIREILQEGRTRAVCIDTTMEELLEQVQNQNFVPVVDDRSVFIGIVTRKDIIKHFSVKCRKQVTEKVTAYAGTC